MNIFIPASLREHGAESDEGAQWLDSLPERIAELERKWRFRAGPALDHGGVCSWVAPVECEDGSEAILKIGIPHDEARFEAEALRFLDGHGAVRLLHASDDGFSLLLERCVPGTNLWALGQEEADAVAAEILRRLWREPTPSAPFLALTDLVVQWCEEMPQIAAAGGYDSDLVTQALALGRELAASQPQRVLLHGDFHPGNVLAAQREPWLVIDPKPVVGDPAYDLAQWLGNRYDAAILSADPVAVLRQQIVRFSERLGLDPARIAGWTFVKALGWEWGPEALALFHRVAQAW
ncbi:MAG TPA: aminoglycoside phosphotransferase family protein [Chthonomonadaceae bacterium]|nr:aminoglycoside phosphotransferase family protein [Chthonomonadaceae bacterium]